DKIVLGLTRNEEGGRLILSEGDGRVEICDVMTGKQVGPLVVIPNLPASAAISDHERFLATIHADGKARIWDLSTGESRELPCDSVLAVTFHKDGTLITQHARAVFRAWDRNGKELPRPVNETRVAYAVLSNNANWLFAVDQDNVGRLW